MSQQEQASKGRQRAITDLAAGLRRTGLEGIVAEGHEVDYVYLADQALDVALDGGAVMLAEEHKRKMRELAKELGA